MKSTTDRVIWCSIPEEFATGLGCGSAPGYGDIITPGPTAACRGWVSSSDLYATTQQRMRLSCGTGSAGGDADCTGDGADLINDYESSGHGDFLACGCGGGEGHVGGSQMCEGGGFNAELLGSGHGWEHVPSKVAKPLVIPKSLMRVLEKLAARAE